MSIVAFTHLHAGLLSDIKRKTLPAIAEIMGLENAQGLHHFLTPSRQGGFCVEKAKA
jgi:SRSO17 transposase